MAETKIEWTATIGPDGTVHPGFTFNAWVGCQKVSPGCDNCYAEGWAKRSGQVQWGPHATRKRTSASYWKAPRRWAERARKAGVRFKVFTNSLSDVFDNRADPQWRADLFGIIRDTPELDWLMLTKRPENIEAMAPEEWPRNIWLGVTAESQEFYDRRWAILRKVPVAVRFISYEPALGPLTLGHRKAMDDYAGLPAFPDWIICGGESGGKARVLDEYWARCLLTETQAKGVAFYLKQMTGRKPIPPDLYVRQYPRLVA